MENTDYFDWKKAEEVIESAKADFLLIYPKKYHNNISKKQAYIISHLTVELAMLYRKIEKL